jgi:hypothetical protein
MVWRFLRGGGNCERLEEARRGVNGEYRVSQEVITVFRWIARITRIVCTFLGLRNDVVS